jgi:hypothetical protein
MESHKRKKTWYIKPGVYAKETDISGGFYFEANTGWSNSTSMEKR